MKRRTAITIASLAILIATTAQAQTTRPRLTSENSDLIVGGVTRTATDVGDTTYLLGGPGTYTGKFETADGAPNWHGWTHEDVSHEGVGDFAKIWVFLDEIDYCFTNYSAQVGFIDDGIVVPGTGGTMCTTWCYGPGGYIVNNTGGLAGTPWYINDMIESSALTWPDGADAATLAFDVYRHEELSVTSPGVFYQWHVRSVNTGDAGDLALASWEGDGSVNYGGPGYLRQTFPLTSYLVPGRTHIQVALRCVELGWMWGIEGTDGTPAPYFDNVAVKAYPLAGPDMSGTAAELAQDSFPERGEIDLDDLASDFIRFDMAMDISEIGDMRIDPGDSIVFHISLPRPGAVLNDMPRMVVKMKANPLFDGVRVLPDHFARDGNIIDGWVYGDSTFAGGIAVPNTYNFDLPDSDFFFPGDVIHYYLEAQDNVNGNIGTATAPADLAGFDNFHWPVTYDSTWIVRGLPSVLNQYGDQPQILYWDDSRTGEDEWLHALNRLGYQEGFYYDEYVTNAPSSGVGNGLGSRATAQTLAGYDVILYSCGTLSSFTLGNGDEMLDPSPDLQVLDAWLQLGDKRALFTGDDLVSSLMQAGALGAAFVDDHFGVTLFDANLRPYISNQTAPEVQAMPGDGVFYEIPEWIAYGGCVGINTFDAVTAGPQATRLAEFLSPSGQGGAYPYAAATRKTGVADVVTLPYDLEFVYATPDWIPPRPNLTARDVLLLNVLVAFDVPPPPLDIPDAGAFTAVNYPNPFNPQTTIALNLPRATDVSLKVFNVRGELVRTLVHGIMDAGAHAISWNGTDGQGARVSSGVYFYEARAGAEVKIGKMTLVK